MASVVPAVKPGYQTSEFISTILIHCLAGVVALLDVLHIHWNHVSAVQGAIPVASLFIAAIVQAAYTSNRTKIKAQHLGHTAEAHLSAFVRFLDKLEEEAPAIEAAVEAADPDLAPKVEHVVTGAKRVRRAVETGDASTPVKRARRRPPS